MKLEIGGRHPTTDLVEYSDIDLHWSDARGYTRKDGAAY